MDPVAIIVGAAWTSTGLLCIGLAIPLVRGSVGRNSLYGVRFPESFQSEEAWLAINRYGGQRMILWSIPIMASGLTSFFLPLQTNIALALAMAFGPLICILAPVWESWRFARRLR